MSVNLLVGTRISKLYFGDDGTGTGHGTSGSNRLTWILCCMILPSSGFIWSKNDGIVWGKTSKCWNLF